MSGERIFAQLTSAFGVLALVLACIGIYGIMAYTVAQRTGEIGIWMALGAQAGRALAMVLREVSCLAWQESRWASAEHCGWPTF
jgi:ABC-type antimicrobial peptide transport system permease subunit